MKKLLEHEVELINKFVCDQLNSLKQEGVLSLIMYSDTSTEDNQLYYKYSDSFSMIINRKEKTCYIDITYTPFSATGMDSHLCIRITKKSITLHAFEFDYKTELTLRCIDMDFLIKLLKKFHSTSHNDRLKLDISNIII